MKFVAVIAGVLLALASAVYWASARSAVSEFLLAYQHGDARSIDQVIDWQTIVPELEKQITLSFPDPNAAQAARLAAAAYRSSYLAAISNRTAIDLDLQSQSFTHFDEYVLRTSTGNSFVFSRRGLRWPIEHIMLSLSTARLYTIGQLAVSHGDVATVNVHNGDVYFDDPSWGCRLTTLGDVVVVGVHTKPVEKASPSNVLLAYVRRTYPVRGKAILEVWQLLFPSFEARLLLKGEEQVDRGASLVPDTEVGSPILFSDDGRYLYYNARESAVSEAIVELDTARKSARVVADGSGVYVVRQGRFTGAIVTSQHRYHLAGGSYDWAYVIDRTGKELMNSGGDVDMNVFIARVEDLR
jgi:hypothetical protein